MATTGINCRATSGYVTDGTDETYCLATDAYPTVRGGITFGLEATYQMDARDRNSGNDRRLAGMIFPSSGYEMVLKITLSAADARTIRLALGDPSFATTNVDCILKDDTSGFQTISHVASLSDQYYDASDNLRTSASDWVTNNTSLANTFSTTSFRVDLNSSLGNASPICHVSFVPSGGGGGPTIPNNRRALLGVGI